MKLPNTHNNNLDLAISQALAALIYASDWHKTFSVLKEQQELLLLDRASELLNFMISELRQKGELEDAQIVAQYETLLVDARMYGVQVAWESFMNRSFLNPGEEGT